MWTTAFRALDVSVRLETDHDGIAETLGSMTSTYQAAEPEGCALHYRLLSHPLPRLERDGATIERPAHWLDLPPRFELDLYDQLIARSSDAWFLHGAAVATDRGAVVLIGPSDSGKSTLSMALTAQGFCYIADEIVALDAALEVRGVTRPISFTNHPPDGVPEGFATAPYHFRGPLGGHLAILAQPPPDQLCREPRGLLRLVALVREQASPTRLIQLSASEGLCTLWQQTLRQDQTALARAAQLLDEVTVHRLHSSTPDEACAAVLDLLA